MERHVRRLHIGHCLQLNTSQNIIHCVMGILYLSWNSIGDATGCRFLIVDVAHTERWESFKTPQIPYINEVGLAFVSNDDELIQGFQDWSMYRQLDDVLNWEVFVNGFVIGHLNVNWRSR